MAKPLSFDFVKAFIEKEAYTLLEPTYTNSVTQMSLECPAGHAFPMSWKVFSKGHRCPYCAGKRQYKLDEVRQILSDFGYTLLSDTYTSNKQKLKVLGPDGIEYETTLFAIKVNKIIPHLKGKRKTEDECRHIFESLTSKKFPTSYPEWLKNPETGKQLELDGYCEELGLAFEFDGRFHFENKDLEDTEEVFSRDRIKDRLCNQHNVRLIRIPYYISNKRTFIENEVLRPGNFLYVGDPHVQPDNIKEYEEIFDWITRKAKESGTNNIVLLGDLFHTHNVIRMEVLYFWKKTFSKLLKQFRLHVLVGNHDMILGSHDNSELNSLRSLKSKYAYTLNIADAPYSYGPLGFISYQQDTDSFKEQVKFFSSMGIRSIVCHQDFDGAQYENGFFSPHGIPLDEVDADLIISGHIHKRQRFGKLILPGTPRWATASDVNEDKGIWLANHDMHSGKILSETFFPTSEIITPLISIEVREGEGLPDIQANARVHVKLIGSSSWIAATAKKLKGKVKISSKPTDTKFQVDQKRLSSLEEYAKNFKFDEGMSSQDVIRYIENL